MAYGQTGSGKTHTMGTADTSNNEEDAQGLIPNLYLIYTKFTDNSNNFSHDSKSEQTYESVIKVSFLEIYGEDVYDLLRSTDDTKDNGFERPSLSIAK